MLETLPLHHLAHVVSLLAHGHIVAYPTGTSYGLGVNALDHAALTNLTALKLRPAGKPYSVLLPTNAPERFVDWTETEQHIFASLADRPLTLLVKAGELLRHLAQGELVGVRTPDHPFTRELATLLPFPITATSANADGQPPARAPEEVAPLAKNLRLYLVEGGRLPPHVPSTTAALEGGTWRITRKGDVSRAELARALAAPARRAH